MAKINKFYISRYICDANLLWYLSIIAFSQSEDGQAKVINKL